MANKQSLQYLILRNKKVINILILLINIIILSYNEAVKLIRSLTDRCNNFLEMQFRCWCCITQMARKIINECVVWHNLCFEHNITPPKSGKEIDVEGNC